MCAQLAHVFVYEFAQPRAEPFTALFLMVPTRCRPSRVRCRHGGAHATTTPSTITRRNGEVLSVQPASTSPAWRARATTINAPAAPWRCPNAPSTWNSGLPMPALLSHTSLGRPGPHTTHLRRRAPGQAMPRQDCVVYARSAGDTPPMLHCHCVCPMLHALARLTLRSAEACDVDAASLQRVRTCVPCSVLRTWRLMTESWCTSA